MPYAPGSFSKNFAWHGRGMRKLYDAIRAGFQGRLASVTRDDFRAHCGIDDPNLQLIPINFFLHNTVSEGTNWVSVDELVFQAISQPHTLHFDRLALFSLHLNMAGERRGQNGVSTPALWANEYVTQKLWRAGGWEKTQLEIPQMDEFLFPVLDAEPDVLKKCRSNYRHLYELCEYLPSATSFINTGYEHWVAPAAFLALDRYLLDAQEARRSSPLILGLWLRQRQLFKLVGAPPTALPPPSLVMLATEYRRLGGLTRFMRPSNLLMPQSHQSPEVARQQQEDERAFSAAGVMPSQIELLMQEGEEQNQITRREQSRRAQIRSRRIVGVLKHLYEHRCMICGETVQIGTDPDRYYSEGAHILPVGQPHNGPDIVGNMLVLCPNHHLQFDSGMISIIQTDGRYFVTSKIQSDPLEGRLLQIRPPHHPIDQFVEWHYRYWFGSASLDGQQ